jgi:hypothetical protein
LRESSAKRNDITETKIRLGQLKSDLSLSDVRKITLAKEKTDIGAAVFTYDYKVLYPLSEPKGQELGSIAVKGEIIFADNSKAIEDILKDWQKDKKIKPNIIQTVLNVALRDAQVEAIEQAKKVGLPSPVPLPKIKTKVGKGTAS